MAPSPTAPAQSRSCGARLEVSRSARREAWTHGRDGVDAVMVEAAGGGTHGGWPATAVTVMTERSDCVTTARCRTRARARPSKCPSRMFRPERVPAACGSLRGGGGAKPAPRNGAAVPPWFPPPAACRTGYGTRGGAPPSKIAQGRPRAAPRVPATQATVDRQVRARETAAAESLKWATTEPRHSLGHPAARAAAPPCRRPERLESQGASDELLGLRQARAARAAR